MIKSGMNALHNVNNAFQGPAKRVLCVCSAGLLRSPTTAQILMQEYGHNTRACGVHDYALIPISTALISWADEVVFMEQEHYDVVKDVQLLDGKDILILAVPDMYERMNPELVGIIKHQYKMAREELDGLSVG